MEWKSLVEEINGHKAAGEPFFAKLGMLEDVSATPYDRIFIDASLSLDYEFHDEIEKSVRYAKKAVAEIGEHVRKTVLSPKETLYLVDLLEKCYLNLLRHGAIEVWDICECELVEHIRGSGHQLFFHLLSRAKASPENVLYAAEFMNARLVSHVRELFDAAFTFYNREVAEKLVKKMQSIYLGSADFSSNANGRNVEIYSELIMNLLVLDEEDYDYYIENVRNILISRKNNLVDLHGIFLNCLKAEKHSLIGRILESFVRCREIFTQVEASVLQGLLGEYSKLRGDVLRRWIPLVDAEDLARFFFQKRMYSKIVEMHEGGARVPLDYVFCSYVELDCAEEALAIFEREQVSKYGLECNGEDGQPLSSEHVFRLHLKTKNHAAACNVLQSATDIEKFVGLAQIVYAQNELRLLVEAVYIGLEKFRTRDFKMLQVFISLLHIEELDISIFERAEMIVKMVGILDVGSLGLKQKEWVRSVCFNNMLDLVDAKFERVIDLTKIMGMLDPDTEAIYLCLCVYLRGDLSVSEHVDDVSRLYRFFSGPRSEAGTAVHQKTSVLFYKCYSTLDETLAESLFNSLLPLRGLCDDAVTLLISVEAEIVNRLFDRKITVIKEGERRGVLSADMIFAFVTNLSIQGPHVSTVFLEKLALYVDTRYLCSDRMAKIIENQRTLLEIIGDRTSVCRINRILEKIAA